MSKNLHKIIILGAAWGIVEATVGYLLHLFAAGIGGLLWFPIAFFFIHLSYKCSKSYSAVMLTALIAASLKFIDLLFPVRIDMVINPAASIIFEALSAVLVYHFVLKDEAFRLNILSVLLIGFLWRSFYICYVMFLPQNFIDISPAASMTAFSKFMFMNNIINTLCISGGLPAAERLKAFIKTPAGSVSNFFNRNRAMKPVLAALSIVLAVTIQVLTV